MRTCLIFFLIFVFSNTLFAFEIKGKVLHANSYREIDNCYVYIEDQNLGTISEIDGTFTLSIPDSLANVLLVFEHIAFEITKLPITEINNNSNIYLVPRIIQHEVVSVYANRETPEFLLDLPHAYSTIKASSFENRGFIDAGDVLRTDQNIQVEEELSGKKSVTIRAGNPDDVLILFNGIKLNNAFDNEFDASLISLEDIKQFEIIRGSNTSLYGAEAFSGIINIIPQVHKNYNAKFTQRIGSYASGDWSLQLHKTFNNKIGLSYSYKQGASKRTYQFDSNPEQLQNKQSNHFASAVYDFAKGSEENNINFLFLQSDHKYHNTRYTEDLENLNRLFAIRYSGPLNNRNQLTVTTAYKDFKNWYNFEFENDFLDRSFITKTLQFNLRNFYQRQIASLILGTQFESTSLNYADITDIDGLYKIGISESLFKRFQYGFTAILKTHFPIEKNKLEKADLSVSYRYDGVQTDMENAEFKNNYLEYNLNTLDQLNKQKWQASTYRFSSNIQANYPFFIANGYLNFGSNVKFPSLYQQVSVPRVSSQLQSYVSTNLNPEKNNSSEIGLELSKKNQEIGPLNGWHLKINYFLNFYQNKFRVYYLPNTPISFYDNVPNADIRGFELNLKTYYLSSKVLLENGLSHYAVSERAAFPLKSEWQYITNLNIEHAGYSFKIHAFKEGEQIAWIRSSDGSYWEVSLPGFMNMDVHLFKFFTVKNFKLNLSASARNIFKDSTKLEGIALRDRRFYVSFGVQY